LKKRTTIFILALCALAPTVKAAAPAEQGMAPTQDPYKWLESNNVRKNQWLEFQAAETKNYILKNTPIQSTAQGIRKRTDVAQDLAAVTVGTEGQVALVMDGFGKPRTLKLRKQDKSEEVLLSSAQWSTDGNFNFVGLSKSPDDRFLAVTVSVKGAINDYLYIIYDFQQRKVLNDKIVGGVHDQIVWMTGNSFLLESKEIKTTWYRIEENGQLTVGASAPGYVNGKQDGVALVYDDKLKQSSLLQNDKPILKFPGILLKSIISVVRDPEKKKDDSLYALALGKIGVGTILQISLNSDQAPEAHFQTVIPEKAQEVIDRVELQGKDFFIYKYWGEKRSLTVYNLETQKEFNVSFPLCASGDYATWKTPGEQLDIYLSSPVVASRKYTYDLTKLSYLEGDPEKEMMVAANGQVYRTEYIQVKSNDGVTFPMRIVQRADIPRDGSAPAIMTAYGGFSINSSLHPFYGGGYFEFLKRGGTFAFPAIRGGSEFGEAWHQQSMKEKRQNVVNDFNAAAQALRDLKIVNPKKLIAQGGSNGALVISAAALQRPELYGRVIVMSGVYDYAQHQNFDLLCQNLCIMEYGDGRTSDRLFMDLISPLELAKKLSRNTQIPEFLIMNGLDDTRVNPAHSLKFAKALKDHAADPSKIHLLALKNAGHWMDDPIYQDLLGFKAKSIEWAFLFAGTGLVTPAK
jgi:prolyl oligopeptidase